MTTSWYNPYPYTLTYHSGAARRVSKAPSTRLEIRVSGVAMLHAVATASAEVASAPQADLLRQRQDIAS